MVTLTKLIFPLLAVVLVGCSTAEVKERVVTVNVEVPVYCLKEEDLPVKPELITGSLVKDNLSEPGLVAQKYVATQMQLKSIVEQQDKLLRACVKPKNAPTEPQPLPINK